MGRALSGRVLCHTVDFTPCTVCRFIHVAAGVTGEEEAVCAVALAGPDRPWKKNNLCLDPGRVEVHTGQSRIGSPSLMWPFLSRQGPQETLCPCSGMAL